MEIMSISRRDFLLGTGALTLAPGIVEAQNLEKPKGKPFRVVHMTDFHCQPELNAGPFIEKAIGEAMSLKPKPQFVLGGGDFVMDAMSAEQGRVKTQFDLLLSLVRANMEVPLHPCIGNHDIWGWDKTKSKTSGEEALWGKNWFKDAFGLQNTHYSFHAGGWKFIVLDTVQIGSEGPYEGGVDSQQLDWLTQEIAGEAAKTPILVMSHIPLFSPSPIVYATDAKGVKSMTCKEFVRNFGSVKKIFDAHPNVKVSISGHIHLLDRYDFNGVSYLCNGAVCGNWWNGRLQDFEPGFVVMDLFPNGSFEQQFIKWGWTKPG